MWDFCCSFVFNTAERQKSCARAVASECQKISGVAWKEGRVRKVGKTITVHSDSFSFQQETTALWKKQESGGVRPCKA